MIDLYRSILRIFSHYCVGFIALMNTNAYPAIVSKIQDPKHRDLIAYHALQILSAFDA